MVVAPGGNVLFHGPPEFVDGGELHLGPAVGQQLDGCGLPVDIPGKILEIGLYGHLLFLRDSRLDPDIGHAAVFSVADQDL